ncbi:MAG TPA: hypothetical protein VLG25_00845 [Patescibacteria group bacterium]|nr:hypothetical protein [Patescibacteria group bacterium]
MTYSSSLAMGRSQFAGKGRNTTRFNNQGRLVGPISNTIILIILACLLGLLYLTQVTKTNAFGYKINDLQKKQDSLKTERDELEVASARLQALDRIKNDEANKNLVSVAPEATVR